jgi:putative SOS response-associated peptidase YedK
MAYSPQAVADHFRVKLIDLKPSYDLAPGRTIAAVRFVVATGQREMTLLHWGLIPPRTKDAGVDDRMIFARTERLLVFTAEYRPENS